MKTKEEVQILFSKLGQMMFDLNTESALQADLEKAMPSTGIEFYREIPIDKNSRPDFMTKSGIAIEVKIKGQRRAIYRQIERYAENIKVNAIILITNKAIGMPQSVNGKPVYVMNVGRAHL